MKLSIIIPTLNEAESLPKTIDHLASEGISEQAEIIIADGGSTDRTAAIAEERGIAVISDGRSQRAHQLNAGVAASTGELLLFLHADTVLKKENVANLHAAFGDISDLQGGGFLRRFDRHHWFLAISGWMSDRRSSLRGIFIGDQAMFCRRTTFEALGGFDETMDVGEDFDFGLRMRARGPVIALGPTIISSARRFEGSVIRRTLADRRWCLDFMKANGWAIKSHQRRL